MLERIFGPYREYSLLVLRLFLGGIFVAHGSLKLFGDLQGFVVFLMQARVPFPEIMAPVVASIELLGGVALIIGLGTRTAAILLSCIMLVAMTNVTFVRGFAGGYDINLALLGGLLALLLAGPGKFAIGGDL